MDKKKKKYLFLYLKTGGGHLAPARSISSYLKKNKNSETEVLLFDALENSWWFARFVVVDGYRILQNKAKWIFELIYFFNKLKIFANNSAFLVTINTEKYLEKKILEEKPDKIVVFHFLLIKAVFNVIEKHKLTLPVITVVTDPFTAHPLWFLRKVQTLVVFSERLKLHCIKKGIDEKNINVFPFILDEKFSVLPKHDQVEEIRTKLGFTSKKILLIMGGGDGIPNGIAILNSILKSNPCYEIAFVCGRNKLMFDQAMRIKETSGLEKLKVFAFVDFVYELLSISDVVITKCGASTFMEILLSKKVPVINSYIWEQEKGNVDFIVKNHLGIYEKRISKLPAIINKLFSDENELNRYKANIEKVNLQNGTAKVAEFLTS